MTDQLKRVEHKYYIPTKYVGDLKYCLSKILLEDKNNKSLSGYKIKSLYFDTPDDHDLNQKLNGVIFREKYRIRVYDKNSLFGKFEIKRKLNQTIKKYSVKLTITDIQNIISGDYSALEENEEFAYVAKRMTYKQYKPKTIVEYHRYAFYLPVNNIRVTIDSNLSNYGFKDNFLNFNNFIPNKVQRHGHDILEVKFNGSMPRYILDILSSFPIRQSAISKYALSRIDSNTESQGDSPEIPF
jgi:hypothetical protein